MRSRSTLIVALVGVGFAALTGCSGLSDDAATTARRATAPPAGREAVAPTVSECTDELKASRENWQDASYAPDPSLALGQPPATSPVLDRVREQELLRVGVDENTPGFGVRNDEGQLEGLEIELVREIARRIWPEDAAQIDDHIQFVSVVTDEKVPFVRDGEVDLTASVVTINCDRWQDVAFSAPYFTTPQRLLVREDSDIDEIADIRGRSVCVTAGSSTIAIIEGLGGKPWPVEARTDCLVALQEGQVDAVASHATILQGLERQDRQTTKVIEADLDDPSFYGIALPKDDIEFVRFVNGVLEDLRDTELPALYEEWLGDIGYTVVPPLLDVRYRSEP